MKEITIKVFQEIHDQLIIDQQKVKGYIETGKGEYVPTAGICARVGHLADKGEINTEQHQKILCYMRLYRPKSTYFFGAYWWELREYQKRIEWLSIHINIIKSTLS